MTPRETVNGMTVNLLAHIALPVARVLIACFGLLLIYIALFLHEDEEGKLQNRLEELWGRVDDLQDKAISKQAAFLKELLRLLGRGFDRLLGQKLFSARSITVMFCYSWASSELAWAYAERFREGARPANTYTAVMDWLEPAMFFTVGTLVSTLKDKRSDSLMIGFWSFIIGYFSNDILNHSLEGVYLFHSGWFANAVLVGCICDIAFVTLNRWFFRLGAGLNKETTIALILVANLSLASLYVVPFWYWWFINTTEPGFVFLVSSTNLLAVLCAVSIVSVMVLALIHRVLWPIVSRPLYAIARRQLVRQPKLLICAAVIFLTWAIPGWKTFWELLARL